MAIDNTPPRLRLLVTIAIIVVITLVGLDFVFKSYYAYMSDEAVREKMAPTIDRDEAVKAEQAALTSAKVPIDQAMAQLAKGTRDPSIEPQQSEDLGSMTGWTKLPKPAPQPIPGLGGALPAPAAPVGDGGAAEGGVTAGDAGAHTTAGDAAAPHAPAPAPAPAPHH